MRKMKNMLQKIPIELFKSKNDTELIKNDFNGDHDENSIDYLK